MQITIERKRPDQWLARVRVETDGTWRCFQAVGDSRVGALIALRGTMWRYQGPAYDLARQAVVSNAARGNA
jgi:hypothetical protein